MKALAVLPAVVVVMLSQSSPDPVDQLEQVRDKVIARVPPVGYSCVATMDRRFRSASTLSLTRKSCEEISRDRRDNRIRFQLDRTDRLRLREVVTTDSEIYSWTPGPASPNLDEVIHSGDINTGPLAAHLHAILANPLVRFHLIVQNADNLEFGFRVPFEASRYLVQSGTGWRQSGYVGSLSIDPTALELKRLTIDTEQLPLESSLCEASTTVEYPTGSEGVMLPKAIRTRHLYRNGTETEWVTALSDCGEMPAKAPEPTDHSFGSSFSVPLKLEFVSAIDTSTAAAGDVIKARIVETAKGPASAFMPVGATLTGRIMRMEHQMRRPRSFLIFLHFDTVEANSVVSAIRAQLTHCTGLGLRADCSIAKMSEQNEDRALLFSTNAPEIVLPAGYESNWIAGDVVSK